MHIIASSPITPPGKGASDLHVTEVKISDTPTSRNWGTWRKTLTGEIYLCGGLGWLGVLGFVVDGILFLGQWIGGVCWVLWLLVSLL